MTTKDTIIYEETTYKDGITEVFKLYETANCLLRVFIIKSSERHCKGVDRLATLEDHARATGAWLSLHTAKELH